MDKFEKIVVFSNPRGIYRHCWEGGLSDKITFYSGDYPVRTKIGNKLAKKAYTYHPPVPKKFPYNIILPLLFMMFRPIFLRNLKKNNRSKRTLVIFNEWDRLSLDTKFVKGLKRLGYTTAYTIHNPIFSCSGPRAFNILDRIKTMFDVVLTFDPKDAQQYGFEFNEIVYEKPSYISENKGMEYDLFYVGNAKDRLPLLHEIFEKATSAGLKCEFYINHVKEDQQKYPENIHYNQFIDYKSVIDKITKSRALVDFPEKGQTGLTIKVCEGIVYDKKIITSMESIEGQPFYSPEKILIYNKERDLKDFIGKPMANYAKEHKDLFSVSHLIKNIADTIDRKG